MKKSAETASALVVEDSETIRKIIVKIVNRTGVLDVREVIDGGDTWTKIQEQKPDMILSDWHMAPANGFDLLLKVKGDPETADIPFFMITTESDATLIQNAKDAGTDIFIKKPFTSEYLRLKLRNYLDFPGGNQPVQPD